MDCVKNLTSCSGCTRKHARCHWRDVSREELGALDMGVDSSYGLGEDGDGYSYANGHDDSDDDDSNPLEDLEALEEQEEGLRNARELSRMGWEEGMKSAVADKDDANDLTNGTQHATEGPEHAASPQGVSPHSLLHHHPDDTGLGAEQQALATPNSLHPAKENASPGAPSIASPAATPQVPSEDFRPSFGGFRAVNEVGGAAVSGWRE